MAREWSATGPKYGNWGDVPTYERNYVQSLIDQWEQLAGFTVDIPDWAKAEMASQGIGSLFQVGQYMWAHVNSGGRDPNAYFVPPQAVQHAPGAAWGLTADDTHNKMQTYQQMMMQLTGTLGSWEDFTSKMTAGNGTLNTGLLREQMMQDPATQQTYGWLKYGLDFDQFQQQKLQWKTAFGKELSNEEGIAQLQYAHASASAPHVAEQRPTLSQVEKRQANVGSAQSEVR